MDNGDDRPAIGVDRGQVLARVAVCYFAGIVVAILAGRITGADESGVLVLLAIFATVFGLPFLVAVMVLAYRYAGSIQRQPLAWGVGIPVLASLIAGLVFLSIDGPETAWIAMFVAAKFGTSASVFFFLWSRVSPLAAR